MPPDQSQNKRLVCWPRQDTQALTNTTVTDENRTIRVGDWIRETGLQHKECICYRQIFVTLTVRFPANTLKGHAQILLIKGDYKVSDTAGQHSKHINEDALQGANYVFAFRSLSLSYN